MDPVQLLKLGGCHEEAETLKAILAAKQVEDEGKTDEERKNESEQGVMNARIRASLAGKQEKQQGLGNRIFGTKREDPKDAA